MASAVDQKTPAASQPASARPVADTNGTKSVEPGLKPGEKVGKDGKVKPKRSKRISAQRYMWFAGHVVVSVSSLVVLATYLVFQSKSWLTQIAYRTTFIAAFATYGLSVFRKTGGGKRNRKSRPSIYILLQYESYQYAMLAAVWLISRHHLLKLTPYLVYSTLQAANFAGQKLLSEASRETIDKTISQHAVRLERLVADANILLLVRLVVDVILLRSSGFSLLAYLFYFRLSMEKANTLHSLNRLENAVDKVLNKSFVPAKVKDFWHQTKWAIDHYDQRTITPEEQARMAEKKRLEREEYDRQKLKEIAKGPASKPNGNKKSGKAVPDLFMLDDAPEHQPENIPAESKA